MTSQIRGLFFCSVYAVAIFSGCESLNLVLRPSVLSLAISPRFSTLNPNLLNLFAVCACVNMRFLIVTYSNVTKLVIFFLSIENFHLSCRCTSWTLTFVRIALEIFGHMFLSFLNCTQLFSINLSLLPDEPLLYFQTLSCLYLYNSPNFV